MNGLGRYRAVSHGNLQAITVHSLPDIRARSRSFPPGYLFWTPHTTFGCIRQVYTWHSLDLQVSFNVLTKQLRSTLYSWVEFYLQGSISNKIDDLVNTNTVRMSVLFQMLSCSLTRSASDHTFLKYRLYIMIIIYTIYRAENFCCTKLPPNPPILTLFMAQI